MRQNGAYTKEKKMSFDQQVVIFELKVECFSSEMAHLPTKYLFMI